MVKYKRYYAAALCALLFLFPVTALAEGAGDLPDASLPAAETSTQSTGLSETDPTVSDALSQDNALSEPEVAGDDTTTVPAEPSETETPAIPAGLRVVLNWQELPLSASPVIRDDTMFVSIRAFCEAMGCSVSWISDENAIYVTRSDLTMYLVLGSKSIWANGRNWYMDVPCAMIDGNAMIPIRTLAKVFSCTVSWYPDNQTVYLQGGDALETAAEYYDADDLLCIARLIYKEAGGQSLNGMVAVANVVLNRVESSQFPNTVSEVVFDRRNGVQFTPTASSSFYCTPPTICFTAAKLALEGYETAPDCLYFVSLRSNASCWASRHRTCFGVIGGQVFYL